VLGLLEGLDIDIRLNNVVSEIDYSGVSGVTVKMTDGSSLTSDFVVCTIPLGVLQSGAVTFTPELPAGKRRAMEYLKMGLLNKLYLEFPSVFWDNEVEVLNKVSEIKGLWQESYNLYYYTKQPILLMFTAADFAKDMETWTDSEIVASAMATLKLIYGDTIPDPTEQVITRWGSDPFSQGSYSYSSVGSDEPTNRLAMAATVANRLFFAGEATSDLYPATNHGAYLSG
jgi:monoamine oxidase